MVRQVFLPLGGDPQDIERDTGKLFRKPEQKHGHEHHHTQPAGLSTGAIKA
jgi:hypothetical protein